MDNPDKNDDEKDLELDLMAEQELLRLTRQFRVMEGDKEAYLEEATKALRRQRKILDDLDKEQKDLHQALQITRSKRNSRRESENAAKLARLAEEQENLISAIQHEKLVSADLESDIQRIERQIAHQRKTAAVRKANVAANANNSKQQTSGSGPGGPSKAVIALKEKKDIGHRIVLLENRLDGVMINFNATLSKNCLVRKEIDHLVQERSSFNDMIAKVQKKIAANKKTIADITELAIQAFDQRDECQSKIQALQERNEKDAQQYASELKELQRTLDHDEKLKDFLFHKSNDRVLATQFEDDDKEKGKKAAEEKEKEDIQKYREAFEKIQNVVGTESNLDKIVADFIKVEDQNFALFNYVTEMNNQVEALQEGIGRLKGDIKEAKGRGEERERQQREQLHAMEKRLESSTHEADSAETKLNLMESVISKLKVGTEDLYLNANVGSTPVLALLGGAAAKDEEKAKTQKRPFVTENNVIMYLDLIHEKVIELKGFAQFLETKAGTFQYQEQLEQQATLVTSSSKLPYKSPSEKQLKRLPSSAQLLGKDDHELESLEDPDSDEGESKPFDMSALKTRAFVLTQRERKEENNFASTLNDGTAGGNPGPKKSKSKK